MSNSIKSADSSDERDFERESTNLWFFIATFIVGLVSFAFAYFRSKDLADVAIGVGTG